MSDLSIIMPAGAKPPLLSMPVPQPTLATVIIERIRAGATLEETKQYYEFLREIETNEAAKQAKRAYDQARSQLEIELIPIATDCANPQTRSKYASLGQVVRAIRPLYSRHGIVVDFDTAESPLGEMWVRVLAYVAHSGGYGFVRHVDMPADGKGAQGRDVMTRTHAIGSAVTYGRRYLLLMIFNLAVGGEDDDGNAAPNGKPTGDLLNSDQMEEIWQAARDVTDQPEKFIARLVAAVGCQTLVDVPASKFEEMKTKIDNFAKAKADRLAKEEQNATGQ